MGDSIVLAGRLIDDAFDRVARYCGLPWSAGENETWAWGYYDAVQTETDSSVTPVDVLAAASLHPGLSKTDLTYFRERASDLSDWLSRVDPDMELAASGTRDLWHLSSLVELADGISMTLLSKVLHRKRPLSIPLIDRHIVDWYRPVTGERQAVRAWPLMVQAIREDLCNRDNEYELHVQRTKLHPLLNVWYQNARMSPPSSLRYLDIAIWMEGR